MNYKPYLDMRKARSKKFRLKDLNSRKSNYNYVKSNKKYSNSTNKNHVVVKLTGGAKSSTALIKNFDYDTRENTLPIYDKNGIIVPLEDVKRQTLVDYETTIVKKNKENEPKRSYRMIFSMNGKIDENILKEAVKEVLQKYFKDNNFYYSLHPDTNNNHVHATVMKKSLSGDKNLHIDKNLLNQIKNQFAINLKNRGIDAVFKSETDKQTAVQREQNKIKRENKRKNNNVYKVVDFGKANFNFDASKPVTFYLFMETCNGKPKNMWNKGLEEAIKTANVNINDYIRVKEIKDENNKSYEVKKWMIEKIKMETETLKINEIGNANYQFRNDGKKTKYIECENKNKETKIIWDKVLARELLANDVKRGDTIIITSNSDQIKINRKENQKAKKDKGFEM